MKVLKTMKKLKFWSRKKKKKKINVIDHHLPSTCHPCSQYQRHSVQPSAPPLPSWLDYAQTHDSIFRAEVCASVFSGFASSSQAQFSYAPEDQAQFAYAPEDTVPELSPVHSTLPVSTGCSYQQYMVPNPVYGMPVLPPATRERSAGIFGRAVKFCVHLIRCFCPCFRIEKF
ncbi:hypothetical protein RJ639_003564 [Escallonia herrerae]|uniref:Uncharacterized protein n=1 Tax=Escallonia herrerae TaxID=1293975 RepID=A0AA89AVI7_9ASTE|nr:hypothetical protein RJ639_003564 [Escallonia herrerae]